MKKSSKHQLEQIKIQSLFDKLSYGIFIVDATTGQIIDANQPAQTILNYTKTKLIGKTIRNVPILTKIFHDLKKLNSNNKTQHVDLQFKTKNKNNYVELVIKPQTIRGKKILQCNLHEHTQQELESKKLAAIIESSQDAIIGKTLNGTITSWNHGAQQLYKYTAKEVIGKNVSIIAPKHRKNEIPQILKKISKGQRIQSFETERQRKDGVIIPISLTVSPVLSNGKIIGAAAIGRDIRARKNAEAKLNEAYTQLKKINDEKDTFISLLAHELRSPLIPIIGYIEMMIDGKIGDISDEQKEKLEICYRNANNLNLLISDFLDLTRLDLHRVTLEIQKNDLIQLIHEVSNSLTPLAQTHNAKIIIKTPKTLTANFDKLRFTQILTNLIKNAIVHNQKKNLNQITIFASENRNTINIIVKDQGEGIAKNKIPLLFDRMTRMQNSVSSPTTGTGLGLIITRELIELHNGNIQVSSKLGIGSRFTITMPK